LAQDLILGRVDVEVHLSALAGSARTTTAKARRFVDDRLGRYAPRPGCGLWRWLGLGGLSGAFEPVVHVALDQELPLFAQLGGASVTPMRAILRV
jgi:hypothetical protein